MAHLLMENGVTGNGDRSRSSADAGSRLPGDLSETASKAFDFAQDVTKQLVALATGIIAFSITFFKDFAVRAPKGALLLMAAAWVIFLVSVVLGILTLMGMTGTLQPQVQETQASSQPQTPSIYAGNIKGTARGQVYSFAIGLAASVAAGIWALKGFL